MPERWEAVRDALLDNRGLKLMALLLAVLTYYAVRTETGYEVDYEVPVQVKMERGIAILEQNPMAVRVRFRGSQEDLLRLDVRKLKAVVQPSAGDTESAEAEIPVRAGDIDGMQHVRPLRIEPPMVKLVFDREIGTIASVAKPKIVGTPLVGKAEVEFEPQSVRIRGPKRRLDELKRDGQVVVQTEPVDVDGRVKSFTKQIRVVPPGDTWVSQIEPSTVTAKVSIVSATLTRQWKDVPVLALSGPGAQSDVLFEPPAVSVTLEGSAEQLDRLTQNAMTVFVDCVALDQTGAYQLPVAVHIVDAPELRISVEPDSVKVVFGRRTP